MCLKGKGLFQLPLVFDDPPRKLLPTKQEQTFPFQVLPQRGLASDVAWNGGEIMSMLIFRPTAREAN